MELRQVDHKDPAVAKDVVRIQRRAYAVEAQIIQFDAIPNLKESEKDLQRLDLSFAGAFVEGALVGFIGYRHTGGVVDIDRLAVDPSAFRRGIGTALLRFVVAECGPAEYVVSTGAANAPAVALYESLGFSQATEEEVTAGLRVVHLRNRVHPC